MVLMLVSRDEFTGQNDISSLENFSLKQSDIKPILNVIVYVQRQGVDCCMCVISGNDF